jgi:predicted Zn-dependent peptidase
MIGVGLAKEQIPLCLNVIREELARISNEGAEPEELQKALKFVKASAAFAFENSLSEASYYSNQWCLSGKITNIENELRLYDEVAKDPEFIRETAKKLFSVKPAILIVGNDVPEVKW